MSLIDLVIDIAIDPIFLFRYMVVEGLSMAFYDV